MSKFDKIIGYKLCMGCGLCESLGKEKGYKLSLKPNGFYSVDVPESSIRDTLLEAKLASCCPSVSISGVSDSNIWGHNVGVYNAYSTDSNIRYKASSGGFVTSTCIYLLEKGLVNGVLHVGLVDGSPIENKLKVSFTKEEIINNCSSRYAPALVFSEIKQILDLDNKKYAFVGKSCDILCLNNFIKEYPSYKDRIYCTICIFCAGMPSYNASIKIADSFKTTQGISRYQYRGNGWPGDFTIIYDDSSCNIKTYEDAWMNYLGKDIHYRCKVCPDSVGTIADISVCDSWVYENGKISFADRPGVSCVLLRSSKSKVIFDSMLSDTCIEADLMEESMLNYVQPNHVRKRLSSGYKLAFVNFTTGRLFNLKDLSLIRLCAQYNILRGIKEALGAKQRLNNWLSK